MVWFNEPSDWSIRDGVLRAVTSLRTDFWRETFYGWTTDNGHFLGEPVAGDFTAEVVVAAACRAGGDVSRLPDRPANPPRQPRVTRPPRALPHLVDQEVLVRLRRPDDANLLINALPAPPRRAVVGRPHPGG
ncbi:DUF1349 domain-containing protein [Micromonospora sp. CPCC 205539]|uniref:DUF1349 domain-containing protein n=1 Tax=Micromonospora sp. CPCC 205539 TaxID=3122408 RepID=UPI002FF3A326